MASHDVEQEFRTAAESLLPAARAGSTAALGQLLEHSRRYLLAAANQELSGALQTKASGSDLVQDTLAEAVKLFVRFTGDSAEELRQWLVAILRNKVANFKKRYLGTDKRDLDRESALAEPQGLRDDLPSPSSVVSAQEQTAALLQALQRLPERPRQVIPWRNWDNLSYAEIDRRVVCGCHQRAIKMWSTANGQEVLPLPGHLRGVTSLTFSADGRWLLSSSLDGTVRLWDAGEQWRPSPGL
jgi:RNA polymerase sigma-70 factor, ECF subfamily